MRIGDEQEEEAAMAVDLHKFALRLKVVEILGRYAKVRQQVRMMQQWKKLWIHPN